MTKTDAINLAKNPFAFVFAAMLVASGAAGGMFVSLSVSVAGPVEIQMPEKYNELVSGQARLVTLMEGVVNAVQDVKDELAEGRKSTDRLAERLAGVHTNIEVLKGSVRQNETDIREIKDVIRLMERVPPGLAP